MATIIVFHWPISNPFGLFGIDKIRYFTEFCVNVCGSRPVSYIIIINNDWYFEKILCKLTGMHKNPCLNFNY